MLLSSLRSKLPPCGCSSRVALLLGLTGSDCSAVGMIEGSAELVFPHFDYLFLTGAAGVATWEGFGGIFGSAGG
jgi:hypothetical protein